ncbi:MAG: FAD:protein FMN transferase [Spirochaetaceae bacterium]
MHKAIHHAGGWVAFVSLALVLLAGCSNTPEEPDTRTELILGTTVTIRIYEGATEAAFERAFDRVQEIEERMSTNTTDYSTTELIEVNRAAGERPVAVSEDTFYVVRRALEYSRMTDGAFDVSIEPLVDLWGIGTEYAAVPSEEEIAERTAKVDYRNVRLDADEQTIYLPEEGMGLDVGGIAKGFAAEEVARILREEGIEHALLDFGGNIITIGTKPDGSRWRIGIQNPLEQRGEFLGIVEDGAMTVVTAGDYERYFEEDGVRYHHIIDSRTGYPARSGLSSVTIVAEDSTEADTLATAVYVMGVERGAELIESLDDTEAAFVTKEHSVYMTSGMPDRFDVTNEAFEIVDLDAARQDAEAAAQGTGRPSS